MSISDKLGDRLREAGGDIRLGHKVVAMDFTGETGVATCENGARVRFRTALVAMAPPLANRIEMTPPLPQERTKAASLMKMGQTVLACVHLTETLLAHRHDPLPAPGTWAFGRPTTSRATGFRARRSSPATGRSSGTMDNVSDEGDAAMFAFIVGRDAEIWHTLPPAKREALVLQRIGELFGADRLRETFVRYEEKDWTTDPFSAGCPACHFGAHDFVPSVPWIMTGHMPEFQNGRLFFASTESAKVSNGYMSGAIWSGEETAKMITARLWSGRAPAAN